MRWYAWRPRRRQRGCGHAGAPRPCGSASSCLCRDRGRDYVIQRRSALPTAQRPKVPLAGLGGGHIADEPKAAAAEELCNLDRIQAEPPRLAPASDAFDPAAGLGEPGTVARKHGPVDV